MKRFVVFVSKSKDTGYARKVKIITGRKLLTFNNVSLDFSITKPLVYYLQ